MKKLDNVGGKVIVKFRASSTVETIQPQRGVSPLYYLCGLFLLTGATDDRQ